MRRTLNRVPKRRLATTGRVVCSLITTWRRQRARGELARLAPRRRGPQVHERAVELARLQRENARLRQRLQRAELIIEAQKNVSGLLGLGPAESEPDEQP